MVHIRNNEHIGKILLKYKDQAASQKKKKKKYDKQGF